MSYCSSSSFERCCRLCAEEQDVTVILFSAAAEDMLLHDKLSKYLYIQIQEDDELPKNICIKCLNKVHMISEFIEHVQQAQEELKKRLLMTDQTSTTDSILKRELLKVTNESVKQKELPQQPKYFTEILTYTEEVTLRLIKTKRPANNKIVNSNNNGEIRNPQQKPFPCKFCQKAFVSELALKSHTWICLKSVCKVNDNDKQESECCSCSKKFANTVELVEHLKEHKSTGICQICGRRFRTEKTYYAHMAVHMSPRKTFTCKVCGRSYGTWGSLRSHSITHSNERPFKCEYCQKSFKRNQELKFHINQHTGDKPYKCPFCDKTFASSGNCYSHRLRIHPERHVEGEKKRSRNHKHVTARLQDPNLVNVRGIVKYQCKFCQHSFAKMEHYMYHLYQHTGEKPFQCTICAQKFMTKRGLLIHHNKDHRLLSRNLLLNK